MDRLSDYDYELPEELIAQTPLECRDASRLLWLGKGGAIEHRRFRDVSEILAQGDLLVVNDTRVTAVRLRGRKATGAEVEALLLRNESEFCFEALVKPGKRLHVGTCVTFEGGLVATVLGDTEGGGKMLRFKPVDDFEGRLNDIGQVPLPPYIHELLADSERYQTVYGVAGGSSAAPTAGLHFTAEILESLCQLGVGIAHVTLDVGVDTFRPVQTESLEEHIMHGERCTVSVETAEKIASATGRIIAVGTTTVRTLESFAIGERTVGTGTKETKLFIKPGYRFQVIDGMFTNFHLPRTTMLMMISALAGCDEIKHAYREAVAERYRFLSFGDSMLIL